MVLTDRMLEKVRAIIKGVESGKIQPVQVSKGRSEIEIREILKSTLIIVFLARNRASLNEICGILKEKYLPYADFSNVSKILKAAGIKPVREKPGPRIGKKFHRFRDGRGPPSLLSSAFPKRR